MPTCVYHTSSTTLQTTAGVVPDDCNHIKQTRAEYDDRSDTISVLEQIVLDLQDQLANSTTGTTSVVEISPESIALLQGIFDTTLTTFDTALFENVMFAMIAAMVIGLTGGLFLNSIRKGRRIL